MIIKKPRSNAVGSVPYRTIQNFGIDPVTKLAHRVSPLVNMHTLVRFNVSGLGITSSNVLDAKVYMKCIQIDNNQYSSQSSSLYTLNREWNEGTKWAQNASTGEVTWGYAKYNQVAWGAGGANASTDRNTSADGTTSMTTTPGVWDHWDATDSVKSWLSSTNYGAVIIPNWSDRTEGWVYHSDNATTGSDRPYLVINVNCTYPTYTPIDPGRIEYVSDVDDDLEHLGDSKDQNDGVIFKVNGVETTDFHAGDVVYVYWNLTTSYCEGGYGEGQYLRIYIDYNTDCSFSGEKVSILSNNDTTSPVMVEYNRCLGALGDGGNIVGSYDIPDNISDCDYVACSGNVHVSCFGSYVYKFTIPSTIDGKITTGLLALLGYAYDSDSDPTYSNFYGDSELYSITITGN